VLHVQEVKAKTTGYDLLVVVTEASSTMAWHGSLAHAKHRRRTRRAQWCSSSEESTRAKPAATEPPPPIAPRSPKASKVGSDDDGSSFPPRWASSPRWADWVPGAQHRPGVRSRLSMVVSSPSSLFGRAGNNASTDRIPPISLRSAPHDFSHQCSAPRRGNGDSSSQGRIL
jgi:hypothetical protein